MKSSYVRTTALERINPADTSFMLPLNELYLGVNIASQLMQPSILPKKDLVHHFLRKCHEFLVTGSLEIQKRFPINDSIDVSLVASKSFIQIFLTSFLLCVLLLLVFLNLVSSAGSFVQLLDDEWSLGKLRLATLPFGNETPLKFCPPPELLNSQNLYKS